MDKNGSVVLLEFQDCLVGCSCGSICYEMLRMKLTVLPCPLIRISASQKP